MDHPNAFLGKPQHPSDSEVAAVLGPAAPSWEELVQWMADKYGITRQEWKGAGIDKHGWTLRLLNKKKVVVYLSPCEGCFGVGITLNSKATQAAKEAHLPKEVAQVLDEAPHYAEGTGVRLFVHSAKDLPPIEHLAGIKLAS